MCGKAGEHWLGSGGVRATACNRIELLHGKQAKHQRFINIGLKKKTEKKKNCTVPCKKILPAMDV